MGPGLLPALFPQSLISALEGGGDPVSMDFPLQLRFPDAQNQSRRVGLPGAQPSCLCRCLALLSPLLLLLKIFPKERKWKGYQKGYQRRNFAFAVAGWVDFVHFQLLTQNILLERAHQLSLAWEARG